MNNRILAFLAGVFLFAGCASLTADKIDRNALLNLYYVKLLIITSRLAAIRLIALPIAGF